MRQRGSRAQSGRGFIKGWLTFALLALLGAQTTKAGDLSTEEVAQARLLPTWIAPGGDKTRDGFTPYHDSVGTVARMAGTKTTPFRLDPSEGRFQPSPSGSRDIINDYQTYKKALEKYPNIRACLADEQKGLKEPNLSQLDWESFRSHSDAYACFGWVILSYDTLGDVMDWMQALGFPVLVQEWPIQLPNDPSKREPHLIIGGFIKSDKADAPYSVRRDFSGWVMSFIETGYGFSAQFGLNGGLKNMRINAHNVK